MVAGVAVILAHALLYYVAPNAKVPFEWITPGGFAHSSYTRLQRRVGSLGGQIWLLRSDLWTNWCDHGADALALRGGANGAHRSGDERDTGLHSRGEKGHQAQLTNVVRH